MKLYIGNTQTMEYDRLYALAIPERRQKAARLHRQEDRRLCIAAGALAQLALADAGCAPTMARDANGRPYFPQMPALHISFSHSGERALCALGEAPVGCDVERVRPVPQTMLQHCLTPEERSALLALPEQARAARFIRLWVLKESFMKATGMGLRLSPEKISLEVGASAVLRAPGTPCVFYEPEVEAPYRYALCSLNPLTPPPEVTFVGFSGAAPWLW